MAGLGLGLEGHLLIVLCHQPAQEPLGLLADALPPLGVGQSPGVVLLAVFAQPDLPDDPLEQVLHVVMQSGRRLDEFAIEHHGAGSALWRAEKRAQRDS